MQDSKHNVLPQCEMCVYIYMYSHACVSVLHTLRIPSVSVEDHVVFATRDGNWAARNLGLL